jgi:hypothetical protein
MKAFEIYVNGQHLITAGIGDDGALASSINWVGGAAPRSASGRLTFLVSGIDGRTDEYVEWSVPPVGVGDQITFKIVETDQVSPEPRRSMREPHQDNRDER